jgi:serine/threonine protein kinase
LNQIGPTNVSGGATILPADSVRPGSFEGTNGYGPSSIFLQPGTLLGSRYEILEILGEGGMGAVYKAADREVDRVVALKVIRPQLASNPEILARFKQELLLSSQVTHRNVIRIYDLGEAQGIKFITMEFVQGENLHQMLKQRQKLELAEAVDVMEQVASGLAAAHREGIIHRDLKPGNIMREKSGRVVLMDFGLARTFAGDGMTQTGAMLGTIEYMSPEQAQGKELTASSDVFTVGLILYELLAGVTPFHAESAIASLLKRTQQRAQLFLHHRRNRARSIEKPLAGALFHLPLSGSVTEILSAILPAQTETEGASRRSDIQPEQCKALRCVSRISMSAAAHATRGQARRKPTLHSVGEPQILQARRTCARADWASFRISVKSGIEEVH